MSYHDHTRLLLFWLLVCKEKAGQLVEREVGRDQDGVDRGRRPAAKVGKRAAQVVKVHLKEEEHFWTQTFIFVKI